MAWRKTLASALIASLSSPRCAVQSDSMQKGTMPMSDLKCNDADGKNVYLYVDKKD
jgi:hypothetical protein